MPDAKNSFLKGPVITLAVVAVVAIVGAWFILARFNAMSRDAHRQDKTGQSGLAMAAVTLKQDIVALKSQEAGVAARTWGTYKLGLQAELKGDQELVKENYVAAGIAYPEALGNFKKALAASHEDSAAVAVALRPTNPNVGGLQTQTIGRNEPAAAATEIMYFRKTGNNGFPQSSGFEATTERSAFTVNQSMTIFGCEGGRELEPAVSCGSRGDPSKIFLHQPDFNR